MAGSSTIEWTDATWNPTRGCEKVSPGCKHCYAETFAERWRGIKGHAYEQGFDPRLVPDQLDWPLRKRKPLRIFVNSMSDLFGDFVPDEYIAAVFGVMAACPRHTFQVLTKRAVRLREWFEAEPSHMELAGAADQHIGAVQTVTPALAGRLYGHFDEEMGETDLPWPLPNVHLGVSVEDRKYGLPRIDHLRETPAAVRFLSIEPLLEDLGTLDLRGIHWVIVGGESGPGARQLHVEWVRSIVAQCRAAGVPVFVKQLGADPHHLVRDYTYCAEEREDLMPLRLRHRKGADIQEWPEDLRVRELPEARP